jgi:hypothetical protein
MPTNGLRARVRRSVFVLAIACAAVVGLGAGIANHQRAHVARADVVWEQVIGTVGPAQAAQPTPDDVIWE